MSFLDRFSKHGSKVAALATQSFVMSANLAAGVILARATVIEVRGALAVLNVVSSLVGLVGVLGAGERILKRGRQASVSNGALILIASTATVLALLASALMYAVLDLSLLSASLFTAVCIGSSSNVVLLALLFSWRGLTSVSLAGLILPSVTLLGLAFSSRMSANTIGIDAVLVVWLLSELTVLSCCVTVLNRVSKGSVDRQTRENRVGPREVLTSGSRHALSQVGMAFSDRGVTFISTFGGLAATATTSISQSAGSPISLPVQAFTPALLSRKRESSSFKNPYTILTAALVLAIGLVSLPVMPVLIESVFGRQYAELATMGSLVSIFGILTGLWKLVHLVLRANGYPTYALLSNFSAIAACLLWVPLAAAWNPTGIVILLLIYSGAGFTSSVLLLAYSDVRRGGGHDEVRE